MEFVVTGTLYQTDVGQVQALLDGWLGTTRHRSRLFGDTWELRTEQVEFHLETGSPAADRFVLDVRLRGSLEDCVRWTERLVAALLEADILYLVSRERIDVRDPPTEDEVTYAHPEFEARYVARPD